MFKQFEGARLGIFIFIGTVFLVLSILLLGNKESLFVRTITIKTFFQRVEGLKKGAPVRLSGYDIGSVSGINLADDTTGRVEVSMRIDESYIKFIRLDSKASIETEGLVGKMLVTISPGAQSKEVIQEGGIIQAKAPINLAEIFQETNEILSNVKNFTKDFSDIVMKINSGEGSIGKLVNDNQLYNSVTGVVSSADKSLNEITGKMKEISNMFTGLYGSMEKISNNIESATGDVKGIIGDIKGGKGVIGSLLNDTKSYDSLKTIINNFTTTSSNVVKISEKFSENMEALKHNWLFKSYFEQRGYWDKADYEKDLDKKLKEIKERTEELDKKIDELKKLEKETVKSGK
jgi:phospholipid/cholesterol/gamma-HCH transport system substrate-binding protein